MAERGGELTGPGPALQAARPNRRTRRHPEPGRGRCGARSHSARGLRRNCAGAAGRRVLDGGILAWRVRALRSPGDPRGKPSDGPASEPSLFPGSERPAGEGGMRSIREQGQHPARRPRPLPPHRPRYLPRDPHDSPPPRQTPAPRCHRVLSAAPPPGKRRTRAGPCGGGVCNAGSGGTGIALGARGAREEGSDTRRRLGRGARACLAVVTLSRRHPGSAGLFVSEVQYLTA